MVILRLCNAVLIYKCSSNQQHLCNIFFPSSWVGYSQPGFEGQQYILEEGEYLDCNDWGGSEQLLSLRPILSVSIALGKYIYIPLNCICVKICLKLAMDTFSDFLAYLTIFNLLCYFL